MPLKPPPYLANFDSASGMLRATARVLRGQDFPTLGTRSPLELIAPLVNRLPRVVLGQLYIWSGASEAAPPERMGEVDIEAIARWAVGEYPPRQVPAIFIGSSNGALVHLAAALGAAFLPQTFLIPVRRSGIAPDDPIADMEWAIEPGRALLAANPDLQLHHMHDANQDRLMIQRMTYFRVKRRTLGAAYRDYIERSLRPGGTIVLVECGLRWPVHRVGERHLFQPGAYGGLEPEDYLAGGPRVAEFLEREGSSVRRWRQPEPTGDAPEAEWGFEPALRNDVAELARRQGYRLVRLSFTEPEDLSPLVADLYRWWYRRRGLEPRRLVADSFIVMEPWWTLRTGSVPFWAVFPVERSASRLEEYVRASGPWDEIGIMLFSNGVFGAGFAGIERWRQILRLARSLGTFLGVDEGRFPRDFATFKRYHTAMRNLRPRIPIPASLELDELDAFLAESADRYPISFEVIGPGGELSAGTSGVT